MAETLAPLTTKKIDTLILGCTHYPLLRPIIQNVVGENVQLIDSGAETVGEVSYATRLFPFEQFTAKWTDIMSVLYNRIC